MRNSKRKGWIALFAVAVNCGGSNAQAQWTNWSRLPNPTPTRDEFGQAVDADGEYAIVGADAADKDAAGDAGAAYIFHWDGVAWSQQDKLTASDALAGDRFGFSAGIDGDYAIVGAYMADPVGGSSGAAYIFKRAGTTWTQQGKLIAADGGAFDLFGYAVGVDGDYAVVGSIHDDDDGESSGSAYIFKRTGVTWSQEAKLIAGDAGPYDSFGCSVGISGDYAVVGARRDWNKHAAYIFKRDGTNWGQEARLLPDSQNEYFGWRVAIDGDLAAVGAPGDDDGAPDGGSVYVFARNGTNWTRQALLLSADSETSDWLGSSVGLAGDYVVAGAQNEQSGGWRAGSGYVFKRSGADRTLWSQHYKYTPADITNDNQFGNSYLNSGNGAAIADTTYTIIFGCREKDSNTGAAYIHDPLRIVPVVRGGLLLVVR